MAVLKLSEWNRSDRTWEMKFVQNIERTIQDFSSFSIKVENNVIANLPIARRLRETEMWAGYLHEG